MYSRTQADKGGKPTPGAGKEEDLRPDGDLRDEWESEDKDKTEFEEPLGESAHMVKEGVMQAGNRHDEDMVRLQDRSLAGSGTHYSQGGELKDRPPAPWLPGWTRGGNGENSQ